MSDGRATTNREWITEYILPSAMLAKRAIDTMLYKCPSCDAIVRVQLDIHRWCFEVDGVDITGGSAGCRCAPEVWDDLDIFKKGEYYGGMSRCSRVEAEESRAKKEFETELLFERTLKRPLHR